MWIGFSNKDNQEFVPCYDHFGACPHSCTNAWFVLAWSSFYNMMQGKRVKKSKSSYFANNKLWITFYSKLISTFSQKFHLPSLNFENLFICKLLAFREGICSFVSFSLLIQIREEHVWTRNAVIKCIVYEIHSFKNRNLPVLHFISVQGMIEKEIQSLYFALFAEHGWICLLWNSCRLFQCSMWSWCILF